MDTGPLDTEISSHLFQGARRIPLHSLHLFTLYSEHVHNGIDEARSIIDMAIARGKILGTKGVWVPKVTDHDLLSQGFEGWFH